MTNPAAFTVPRNERRRLLRAEQARRKSGDWGPWERVNLPNGISRSRGWTSGVRAAYRNGVFSVLDRMTESGVRHLAISSLSGKRPSWWEAQRIKNELAGQDATAVEVYPPQSEVVDGADMYHLWVVPVPLPFSLYERRSRPGAACADASLVPEREETP